MEGAGVKGRRGARDGEEARLWRGGRNRVGGAVGGEGVRDGMHGEVRAEFFNADSMQTITKWPLE
ncbi:predicted protein [Plenodomus lingam JN3]|uniref:Predicted protein n=1 Tax=Leptosphaeria maculans (strain JN3 / isolate v23.1.3 / race Av1-4-5-6-7-8) TaxID=985895 RepID=E4ZW03_LEPMJ|nr:predicted protein [Plenodomus lingam JN3]CBX95779.1 predicted protein [Plenodomus lingam JN3]